MYVVANNKFLFLQIFARYAKVCLVCLGFLFLWFWRACTVFDLCLHDLNGVIHLCRVFCVWLFFHANTHSASLCVFFPSSSLCLSNCRKAHILSNSLFKPLAWVFEIYKYIHLHVYGCVIGHFSNERLLKYVFFDTPCARSRMSFLFFSYFWSVPFI